MAKKTKKPPRGPRLPVAPDKERTLQLRLWLVYLRVKQVELAEATGLSASYISNLVKGDKKGPTPDALLKISEALGRSVNALYERPPFDEPPPSGEALETIQELSTADQIALARALDRLNAKKPPR